MKKEIQVPMREFMARFNKGIHKIPVASRPNDENKKRFFLNALPLDVVFPLKRARPATLDVSQTLAIELEDDLITSGKWRKDVQTPSSQPSTSSSLDLVIQRLMNDLITIK